MKIISLSAGPTLWSRWKASWLVATLGLVFLSSSSSAVKVTAGPAIALKEVASGFVAPVLLASLPDGSGRLVVGDQIGLIHVVNKGGGTNETPFFDLRDRLVELKKGFDERGLLGLAFHPQFAANGKVYVAYSAPRRTTAPADWDHTMNISEFKVEAQNRATVDGSTERVLLRIDKPYFNHNSGRICFGADGLLYVGVGDGGNAHGLGIGHSAKGNSQDLTNWLGKILRIDVNRTSGDKAYGIPNDNPFAQGGGLPEIFAYGLRNTWGLSVDRGGQHELFAADVGQAAFEEINIIVRGGNYGWNRREGFVCFDPKNPTKAPEDCPKVDDEGKPFLNPIVAYKNFGRFPKDPEARGTSVTGGYVYRGRSFPQLQGKYIFGDWSRVWVKADGVVYVATRPAPGNAGPWAMEPLALKSAPEGRLPGYVWAFGEDEDGELYVMTNVTNGLVGKNGKVFKFVPE